jgi:hypothetical protein
LFIKPILILFSLVVTYGFFFFRAALFDRVIKIIFLFCLWL